MNAKLAKTTVVLAASLVLIFVVAARACAVWPSPEVVHFEVEGREAAPYSRVEGCNMVIQSFADQGTDHWNEQMEQCVYLDPDYLNDEGPVAEGDI